MTQKLSGPSALTQVTSLHTSRADTFQSETGNPTAVKALRGMDHDQIFRLAPRDLLEDPISLIRFAQERLIPKSRTFLFSDKNNNTAAIATDSNKTTVMEFDGSQKHTTWTKNDFDRLLGQGALTFGDAQYEASPFTVWSYRTHTKEILHWNPTTGELQNKHGRVISIAKTERDLYLEMGKIWVSQISDLVDEAQGAGMAITRDRFNNQSNKLGCHLQKIGEGHEGIAYRCKTNPTSSVYKTFKEIIEDPRGNLMVEQVWALLMIDYAICQNYLPDLRTAEIYTVAEDYIEREFIDEHISEATLNDPEKTERILRESVKTILESSAGPSYGRRLLIRSLMQALFCISEDSRQPANLGFDEGRNLVVFDPV